MPSVKNVILSALSVSTAVSAAVLRRDVQTIASDLKTINSDLTQLTEAVNKYGGGLVSAIPVESAESKLEKSIETASENAKSSEELSSEDSNSLINYINTTLEPSIAGTLDMMVEKQDAFDGSNLKGKATKDINSLREKTNALGESYIGIAAADTKTDGQAALKKIDGDFTEAVAAYGGAEAAPAAQAKVASSVW
ncbi:hypothetical protein MBLNU230_g0535t1 [Neophaeotheca triangularis]